MHNQPHDAAGPQEQGMSQPFEVTESGQVVISQAAVDDACISQFLVSGAGFALPEDWAERSQEKADLLERRLLRLENALGLSVICDH